MGLTLQQFARVEYIYKCLKIAASVCTEIAVLFINKVLRFPNARATEHHLHSGCDVRPELSGVEEEAGAVVSTTVRGWK